MIQIKPVVVDQLTYHDFLDLPKQLYKEAERIHNHDEEVQQLRQTHPLSHCYQSYGFVGYSQSRCVIRAILFHHYDRNEYYLGYFESIEDITVAKEFIQYIADFARKIGADRLIGPVNGSFWISYRMKSSNFNRLPYSMEPHNLSYYPRLWTDAGFQAIEVYHSYLYPAGNQMVDLSKARQRYQRALSQGLRIIHPHPRHWKRYLREIHQLLQALYQDFPLYHPISYETFAACFDSLKYVMRRSFITLAYDGDTLVGFNLSLPDYGPLLSQHIGWHSILRIFHRRYKPERCLCYYLGVDPDHLGLGLALLYPVLTDIQSRQIEAVAGLIHAGKVTQNYLSTYQIEATEYRLYALPMKEAKSTQ